MDRRSRIKPWLRLTGHSWSFLGLSYCWCFRNPANTTWHVWNPVKSLDKQPTSTGARRISEPSTVSLVLGFVLFDLLLCTMINEHVSPPFGMIVLKRFPSIFCKSKKFEECMTNMMGLGKVPVFRHMASSYSLGIQLLSLTMRGVPSLLKVLDVCLFEVNSFFVRKSSPKITIGGMCLVRFFQASWAKQI